MIRTESGCSVSRFAELVGVPRRTYPRAPGAPPRRRPGEGTAASAASGAHRTHGGEIRRAIVWPVTPSRSAISATGLPASTRSNTLHRNSAGYLLGTMTPSSTCPKFN